jgi:hypothetical protein
MKEMVGYCGIICSNCPVYIATQTNSDSKRKQVAEMFTKQYGKEYTSDDINCDGCLSGDKRIFSFCHVCEIRKCGIEKKVENCALCISYPCQQLLSLFAQYPKARETLDAIRREHSTA